MMLPEWPQQPSDHCLLLLTGLAPPMAPPMAPSMAPAYVQYTPLAGLVYRNASGVKAQIRMQPLARPAMEVCST